MSADSQKLIEAIDLIASELAEGEMTVLYGTDCKLEVVATFH